MTDEAYENPDKDVRRGCCFIDWMHIVNGDTVVTRWSQTGFSIISTFRVNQSINESNLESRNSTSQETLLPVAAQVVPIDVHSGGSEIKWIIN